MTERKRATGFALMDTAFTADAKFVRLARYVPDPIPFAAAVGVYWLLLADARRAREPEIDWDDYSEYVEQIGQLQKAKLLTADGFEPIPFARWAPAYRSVPERTPNTKGNGGVRKGTESTLTSDQFISTPNGVGGAGEGGSGNFMGFRPKVQASAEDVRRQHEAEFEKCAQCGTARFAHHTDHEFAA